MGLTERALRELMRILETGVIPSDESAAGDLFYAVREALESRAILSNRTAESSTLRAELAVAKEHGEQYRKNWLALQNATGEQCHLGALEWIAAATARATAAEAHAETLRKALAQIRDTLAYPDEKIESALASTPAMSLAAVKAEALEEIAKAASVHPKAKHWEWDGLYNFIISEAERLRKEAENGR